jgi:hypothetical protein
VLFSSATSDGILKLRGSHDTTTITPTRSRLLCPARENAALKLGKTTVLAVTKSFLPGHAMNREAEPATTGSQPADLPHSHPRLQRLASDHGNPLPFLHGARDVVASRGSWSSCRRRLVAYQSTHCRQPSRTC